MAGQLILRGKGVWLVRVYLGTDPHTGKRQYENKTVHGGKKEAEDETLTALRAGITGKPLLVEPYRERIFAEALDTRDADGRPRFNLVLCGRAKKNWKSADLILAALYRFLAWPSVGGNQCYLLANDEGQAGDDLELAVKLIQANPPLRDACLVRNLEDVTDRILHLLCSFCRHYHGSPDGIDHAGALSSEGTTRYGQAVEATFIPKSPCPSDLQEPGDQGLSRLV